MLRHYKAPSKLGVPLVYMNFLHILIIWVFFCNLKFREAFFTLLSYIAAGQQLVIFDELFLFS